MSTETNHHESETGHDPAGGDPKPVGERVEDAVEEMIDEAGGADAPTDADAGRRGADAVDDETFTA